MIFLNILENVFGYLLKIVEPKKKVKQSISKAEKYNIIKCHIPGVTPDPTDEEIEKYYKMYVVRFEEDAEHEWDTEEVITLEEYSEKAKDKDYGGWRFLFSSVSHCMIGCFDGPSIFM